MKVTSVSTLTSLGMLAVTMIVPAFFISSISTTQQLKPAPLIPTHAVSSGLDKLLTEDISSEVLLVGPLTSQFSPLDLEIFLQSGKDKESLDCPPDDNFCRVTFPAKSKSYDLVVHGDQETYSKTFNYRPRQIQITWDVSRGQPKVKVWDRFGEPPDTYYLPKSEDKP